MTLHNSIKGSIEAAAEYCTRYDKLAPDQRVLEASDELANHVLNRSWKEALQMCLVGALLAGADKDQLLEKTIHTHTKPVMDLPGTPERYETLQRMTVNKHYSTFEGYKYWESVYFHTIRAMTEDEVNCIY